MIILQKMHLNWKKNKKVQILEFGFCWLLSVEFISEIVRDRGNMLTNFRKFSAKSILWWLVGLWCLIPLPTIFQLSCGSMFWKFCYSTLYFQCEPKRIELCITVAYIPPNFPELHVQVHLACYQGQRYGHHQYEVYPKCILIMLSCHSH